MEIHAPHGPVDSLKEFSIHILIVTIGILIALGLEGIRETIHEHHQITEIRDLAHRELRANKDKIPQQREAFARSKASINQLISALPQLQGDPRRISATIDAIDPAFYFFTSSSWETALSTGVLGHMSTEDVDRFAAVNLAVHGYNGVQAEAINRWFDVSAFFRGRTSLSPENIDAGRQKLQLLYVQEVAMEHLLEQLEGDNDRALKAF